MYSLRQYVITVVTAAVVVAMTERISSNTHTKKSIRMVTGLFLTVVLLSPFGDVKVDSFTSYFESIDHDAQQSVAYGEQISRENLNAIISKRCESYILDKANQLGANIGVHVQCDTSDIPIPVYVEITGTVSPYIRKTLQNMIADDIGIPGEMQLWV